MMGDPLGSSCVSSQEQNSKVVVRVQSRQYRATVVERARDVVDPGSGCDKIGVKNDFCFEIKWESSHYKTSIGLQCKIIEI